MARHDEERCIATKRDGTPCRGWRLPGSDYCLAHDPSPERREQHSRSRAIAAERRAAQAASADSPLGPVAAAGLTAPRDRAELRDIVAKTVLWTLTGEVDPKRADAVIKLAQRGMALFPEPERVDPHDSMDDAQLADALEKELRAVRARIVAASGNGGSKQGLEEWLPEDPVDFGDVRGQCLQVIEACGAEEPTEADDLLEAEA